MSLWLRAHQTWKWQLCCEFEDFIWLPGSSFQVSLPVQFEIWYVRFWYDTGAVASCQMSENLDICWGQYTYLLLYYILGDQHQEIHLRMQPVVQNIWGPNTLMHFDNQICYYHSSNCNKGCVYGFRATAVLYLTLVVLWLAMSLVNDCWWQFLSIFLYCESCCEI